MIPTEVNCMEKTPKLFNMTARQYFRKIETTDNCMPYIERIEVRISEFT